jgi:hypothetical protein
LLLAIGFVLMISAISAGLAAAATSSLNNRTTLGVVRNREFAADGAIEKSITQVRPLDCTTLSGLTQDTTNGVAIRVDWTTDCSHGVPSSDGGDYLQRNVVFSACLDKLAQCQNADVIIRAQINFEPRAGTVTKTFVQAWSVNK